ncbi:MULTISPECIES: MbcA/ParS/Xre antitoxin family protein [Sulfitobacter]|jgi:uncharacterized protein (DUF2384 family)|uniref:Antitoxin Xre/MbcA/ParS toxin-binding domain-containing protein n=1 Tax=Sulfitobacter profundi TaxID=2679961 RepID=A0ABW1Z3B3_9RHOB|nr:MULTISPECIES: MbcA/ParS/Xre antitoxin family protein [Sulfitobacter]AYE88090.1 hypothetical protein B5M07_17910 [Sulfitobacter sp. D7]MBO9432198.1 DUF2384 domain-containing protein [Sulfitobacter sp. R18_1]MCZ4368364.1 MbcA/ParS/Xre antitoxin family protein [Sulfitobacter dubius]|tara:strand:+ start:465 stop:653 length:189 start_codon:yes stop_codon:yes gene_type:complete
MTRDQLIEMAKRVLKSEDRAQEWLSRQHPLLNMHAPQDLLSSHFGRDRVEHLLVRIEAGFAV